MKYKKDIEKLLFDLKTNGIERDKIEKDLNYSDNYIDQTLSKGGNKRFFENLKSYAERMLQNPTYPDTGQVLNEDPQPFVKKRFEKKLNTNTVMVPLVPVKTQAGYRRRYANTDFLNELKSYPILPGVDPHGAIWRYFQVDGDSMMTFLNNGDYVLANQIPKEDWHEIKDYQVYVIVTDDLVTIKRVFKRKHFKELVLIPENEIFEQKVINTEDIREIWRYRRHIGWNAAPPKKIEIKV